jgi:transcriptional regulator of acetoin/glycerol metabolism
VVQRTAAPFRSRGVLYHRAMVQSRAIDEVLRAFLGNPFDVAPTTWRAAERALAGLDPRAAFVDLFDADNAERAELFLLAVGHARACTHPDDPGRVFDDALLPPSVRRRLPRQPRDYLRIVMAAGRCFRALSLIHGTSGAIQQCRRATWAACFGDSLHHALHLERVIRDHDVLLLGETGTGKEAFARAIQAATPGPADGTPAPSAAMNAAALPDTLVESELFGHVKGAFTGASETRVGRLRSADGGSFFLDEVGDLPSTTQVKLLRVIETNDFHPVGSDTTHHVDVRYVAATHKDLEALVLAGGFRRDLFERLAGIVIRIPPLRERPEDVRAIALPFVDGYTGEIGGSHVAVVERWLDSGEARGYPWPGNVRELQNVLRNLLLGLPAGLAEKTRGTAGPAPLPPDLPQRILDGRASMQEVNDWYMRLVLDKTESNYTQTAKILGIDRSTVRRRMSE